MGRIRCNIHVTVLATTETIKQSFSFKDVSFDVYKLDNNMCHRGTVLDKDQSCFSCSQF